MRKIFFFAFLVAIFTVSDGLCTETTFFGSIDSRYNSSNNLEDAQTDVDDKKDFMDTKLVLGVNNRFNEYLRGIAAFEVGSIIWGIDGENYPTGRNTGGGPGGDGINVETKNIYLDVSVPGRPINLKCGLMPFDIVNGIIAGDDAFGMALSAGNDLNATLNVIRIYQESIGTRYDQNEDDPDRKEFFADIEISYKFSENVSSGILFGFLGDRYNGPEGNEIDRGIYYGGANVSLDSTSTATTVDFLYDSGIIEHSDVLGNTSVNIDADGWLVDLKSEAKFGSVGLLFEYLYASGDDRITPNKDEGFIVPETSYRTDIAEILTRGVLTDELEDDAGFAAYEFIPPFSNIFFVKGEISYKFSKKTSTSFAAIYAQLPRERVLYAPSNLSAKNVGTELDFKISRVIYMADDMQKGLKLDFIAAVLLSGDVLNDYDATTYELNKANNIEEFGVRLVYEF